MNDYRYDHRTVQGFILSAIFWGVVGILVGLLISIQLWAPAANFPPYLTFGRLRPVHTNGLAFGLGVGAIFGLSYWIVMRLCKRPLLFPRLARVQLWLFNVGIALAAVSPGAGQTQSLEYAELEWPLDLAIVVLWVMFAVNVFGTIIKRREEQMYVALWYVIATVVAVAVLYLVNNLAVPAGLGEELPPVRRGELRQRAVVVRPQRGGLRLHHAHPGDVLLLPPEVAPGCRSSATGSPSSPSGRSSSRTSGPARTTSSTRRCPTGSRRSPSRSRSSSSRRRWGSVVNGYYTVGQDWSKMRTNYLTKFFILGITFYGLQTVQGPTQALRVVSQLIHYTDWVPGHVHMGTMGWVTLVICASIYYVIPKIYGTEIYSEKLANAHFWLALVGQLLFSITMWITGIRQGWMWKATDEAGKLRYTLHGRR